MAPIGRNENSWIIMQEHTVHEGCHGVRYHGNDSALSMNNLMDDENGSDSEYTTTNKTSSGKHGETNNSNSRNAASSTHIVPRNGGDNAFRIDLNQISRADDKVGKVKNSFGPPSRSRRKVQPAVSTLYASLDLRLVNHQIPDDSRKNPKVEIKEWVHKFNDKAGTPGFSEPGRDSAPNDQIVVQNTQNALELAARSGAEHRQIKTQREEEDKSDSENDE